MHNILIIDDDRQLCASFSRLLSQDGYRVHEAHSGTDGIQQVRTVRPDLVILDIRLPDMNGIDVFDVVHDIMPKLPVIIITAFGSTETAISAIRNGAFDYIYKPFDVPDMLLLIGKALAAGRCMNRPVDVNPDMPHLAKGEALVGSSQLMLEMYKTIGRVATTDATVLIRGESGTGKELVARAIYNHSTRADRPFIVINCVAIPETLLESELFGYEKGTFTGALHRRVGKIEQARGGTVFLDEIGDIPLALQAKFLRLLQENNIERLGGKEPVDVDVRIIAATNRDLERAVKEGSFREDLYYRLHVVTIPTPPLRERREDIEIISRYLLARLSAELGCSNPGIREEALSRLQTYDWPGNIRELSNCLKNALIFNRGTPLEIDDLSFIQPLFASPSCSREEEGEQHKLIQCIRSLAQHHLQVSAHRPLFDTCMDEIAAVLIREVLQMTGGNRTQTARMLGVSRPTLHAKMEKYGIDVEAKIS